MKKSSVLFLLSACGVVSIFPADASTSVGIQEPVPMRAKTGQVPVTLASDATVVALQADVQFSSSQYVVSSAVAGTQPEGVHVESAEIEPGRLRVVVYHRSHGALAGDVMFRIPLEAKWGVLADSPVLLTGLIAAGENGVPLNAGIQPIVRLVDLQPDQKVNGRWGVELTASATATGGTVTKVEYYVGGVLLGEGTGNNFSLLWRPEQSGPFEITAIAYDSNGAQASTRTIPVQITHVGTYDGAVLGTYAGLIRGRSFSFANDGYASMTTTTKGAFTVKLMSGGKTYSSKGQFDASGNATIFISRGKNVSLLTVVLAHSSDPTVDQIHGRVSDGLFSTINGTFSNKTFETEFTVDRVVWNAKTRPATMAGNYTVLLPPDADLNAPLGTGFATASVTTAGAVKITATLPDGTATTASAFVSKDGLWPVYASLYKAQGVVMGEMDFAHQEGISDVSGPLTWLRPADAKAAMFKSGFQTTLGALGGLYIKPAVNQFMIPLSNLGSNAALFLSDGGLLDDITRLVTVSAANKALVPLQDADKAAVTLTPATGLFSGTFIHPDTQKSVKFQGAVLQPQGLFEGFFLAGAQGGQAALSPNSDENVTPPEGADEPVGVKPLPVVKITAPAANSTLKAVIGEVVQVKGTATDKQGVANVTYQVLHNGILSAPASAMGTTAWSFDLDVPSNEGGLYIIHVKATDTVGDESEVATTQFWAPLKSDLTVTVIGPGTVTKGFDGVSPRDVGKLFTITAKPNAKKRFTGWTGAIVSSSPAITLLMKEDTVLQANFAD